MNRIETIMTGSSLTFCLWKNKLTFKKRGENRKKKVLCIIQVTLLISAKKRRWGTGTVLTDLPGTSDTPTLRSQIKSAVYCT